MKNRQPIAYVISEFIGAGKTTFSRKLEKETGAIRITKDEWVVKIFGTTITEDENFEQYDKGVTNLSRDIAFRILEAGKDVILDEGFWKRSQRDEIKKKIAERGATATLYYVECPVEEMRARVVARSESPPEDSFEISGAMFDRYLQFWRAAGGRRSIHAGNISARSIHQPDDPLSDSTSVRAESGGEATEPNPADRGMRGAPGG